MAAEEAATLAEAVVTQHSLAALLEAFPAAAPGRTRLPRAAMPAPADIRQATVMDDRAIAAIFLKVDPSWDALHGNPAFRNLVGDITLTTPE